MSPWRIFRDAATCPKRERALSNREQGGPQGCPTSANSEERSAQTNPSLSRTLVRIGQKTPGKVDSGAADLQGSPLGLAWNLQQLSPNPARKPSGSQAPAKLTPPAPSLWGSPPWCCPMGLGLPRDLGMNPSLLPQPSVSRVLSLGASTWGSLSPVPQLPLQPQRKQ